MLTVYDLKNQRMLTQPNFWKLVSGYEQFSGVTFVGSFQIIEKHLLPQFKQVNLILGMEDQRTGQNLNQFFDLTRRVKEITSANEQFISRVADESLNYGSLRSIFFIANIILLKMIINLKFLMDR